MFQIYDEVVRAYGSQKTRGNQCHIPVTAEEMKELPTASLVNMLQGPDGGSDGGEPVRSTEVPRW